MNIDEARTLARQIADARPRGRWPELPITEFAVLLYIGAAACAFDDVMTALDANHGSMSDWTASLESRGLISKKTDPMDLRRKLLFLTPKGRRMLATARSPILPPATEETT